MILRGENQNMFLFIKEEVRQPMPALPGEKPRRGTSPLLGIDSGLQGLGQGLEALRAFVSLEEVPTPEERSPSGADAFPEILISTPDAVPESTAERSLVRTFVEGLDEGILEGGVPGGHVVLVQGPTGAMKSSLAYYILQQNAVHGIQGLYVTVEQGAASLLEHMASLGLATTAVSDSLPILDLSDREQLASIVQGTTGQALGQDPDGAAVLSVLKRIISDVKRSLGFRLLAIDSWDALASLLGPRESRPTTLTLFEWLWEIGVTTLVVSENGLDGAEASASDEQFLADGILQLTVAPSTETEFQRRIRCRKMRCVDHDRAAYALVFEGGRFEAEGLVR